MTSQLAIDAIEALWADNLRPTVRDIVRLNALALLVEDARGRYVRDAASLLPRVAVVATLPPPRRSWFSRLIHPFQAIQQSNNQTIISFRQPTIAHELWLARVGRWVHHDYETLLAINCYALSRPADELCDADDLSCVSRAVASYAAEMAPYTRDQLFAAVDYAKNGADPLDGESGPKAKRRGAETIHRDDSDVDFDECVLAGVLHEGAAVLWGLSVAEIKRMTRQELEATIRRAYFYHNKPQLAINTEQKALGDFYAVVDEIRERLTAEKSKIDATANRETAPSAPTSAPTSDPTSAPTSAPVQSSSGESLHADADLKTEICNL